MSSCDLIADEIAALNAEIASLRQENFVTRYEFEQFKWQSQNGQYLLQNAGFRDYVDGVIDSIFRSNSDKYSTSPGTIDEINEKLKEEIRRRESEDYKLWYEIRYWKDIKEANKKAAEEAKKKAELAEKKADDALKKYERAFQSIAKNTAAITKNTIAIAKTNVDIKLLQTGLANLAASLPALVKSIVLSLIASGIFNGIIGAIMGAWNNAKLNELKLKTDIAFDTALKSWNRANTANDTAKEADKKASKFNGYIAYINGRIDGIINKFPDIEKRIALIRNSGVDISTQISTIVAEKIAPLAKTVGQTVITVAGLTITVAALQKIGNAVLPRVGLNPQLNPMAPTLTGLQPTIVNNNYYTTNNNTYPTTNNNVTNVTNVVGGNNADLTWIRAKLIELETLAKTNLTISGIMNNKLGNQIKDGLSGWMTRFTNWSVFSRLMELMTLAATIHNAMMLSNNLTTTLISAIQNVVNFLELKDSEGKGYDITLLLKQSTENFLKSILGTENYTAMNTAWKNANRIYQSAGNLFNSLLNMGDTITQALQIIGGQTGRIGNALRAWGVVSEKAYPWMNPQPNFNNPVLNKLTNLNEAASVVETVSIQPLTVKDAKKELEEASAQLAKDIGQAADGKDGIAIPEASKVKSSQDASKAASPGKDITDTDLEPDGD